MLEFKSHPDKWKPRPGQTSGRGLLTVGWPLGIIKDRLDSNPIGFLSIGDATWAVDLETYELLAAAQRGHSEKWLEQRLGTKKFRSARDFALQAGLLVKYEGKDATLRGRRSLSDLLIRRRNYVVGEQKNRWRVATPEGSVLVSERVADFAANWEKETLAAVTTGLQEVLLTQGYSAPFSLPTIEQTIQWTFWRALRCLDLGLIWMDHPEGQLKSVRDGQNHFLRKASLWMDVPEWLERHKSLEYVMRGLVVEWVRALALGVPLGNCHDDHGYMIRNIYGEEVEVTADAYALFCSSSYTKPADAARDLQTALNLPEMVAHGRITAATEELMAKSLIRLEAIPEATPVEVAQ
jgi:hypothetical protein